MSAIFNFHSMLVVVVLLICTCTFFRGVFPKIIDTYQTGLFGTFWKCARIGALAAVRARLTVPASQKIEGVLQSWEMFGNLWKRKGMHFYTEKAFQKQKGVFLNKKKYFVSQGPKKEDRFHRNVGLGFKTPREAREGTYIDKKCPFTGNVSIRGRILTGVVQSMKMKRTIVIRRDYLHYIKKYNRFEKRHKNLSCHLSPCFRDLELGDLVVVGQCRPLSKTVRFNVLKIQKQKGGTKKLFKKF